MIITDDFFINLNYDRLKDFPSLLILDLPDESDLKKGNPVKINNPNQLYVFATTLIANGYLKIENNTHFEVIFSRKEPTDFVECNVVLKYVNVNPSYEIDYLPGGHSGLCLLEFPNGKPDILKKLGYYRSKDYAKHDMLILTQKELLIP
jgi:hypothetical protein